MVRYYYLSYLSRYWYSNLHYKSRQTVAFNDRSDDEAWDSKLAEVSTTIEVKRFRFLIIGKSGCGKTTILSKVVYFLLLALAADISANRCVERMW